MKVSVCIPLYNVEQYVERCAHVLFEQTLKDIEYIFVDDGSTDSTIQKLEKVLQLYPQRIDQSHIIRLGGNFGVAHARQVAIEQAVGDYFINCDPDDWLEKDMYEVMMKKAALTAADIVWCGYAEEYKDETIVRMERVEAAPTLYLSAMLRSSVGSMLWNKLIKRSYWISSDVKMHSELRCGEDFCFLTELLLKNPTLAYVPSCLYHYVIRRGSTISRGIGHFLPSYLILEGILGPLLGDMAEYQQWKQLQRCRVMLSKDVSDGDAKMFYKDVRKISIASVGVKRWIVYHMCTYGLRRSLMFLKRCYDALKARKVLN